MSGEGGHQAHLQAPKNPHDHAEFDTLGEFRDMKMQPSLERARRRQ
jgi:hypothetical protein